MGGTWGYEAFAQQALARCQNTLHPECQISSGREGTTNYLYLKKCLAPALRQLVHLLAYFSF